MHLAINFLGGFQVTLDGELVLDTRAKKIEALLAFLALEGDVAHRRENLVGLLFPEIPDDQARTNLRQTLARLRRAISDASATPPFLLTSREATQFNAASDHSVDVNLFESLLAGCSEHNPERDASCPDCMDRIAEAVTLYRGPFMEGFFMDDSVAFDEWVLAHRRRLEELVLDALEELADYHEQRGAYGLAITAVRRQLQIEPWREQAHRQLMRLLAYQGKREAALKQYQILEQLLEKELGVTPLAETRALRDRITVVQPNRPHQLPPANPLFIGREEETALLHRYLARPECRLIALVGSGGSGKTALALEAAWQAATQFMGPFPDGVYFVPLAGVAPAVGFDPLAAAVAEAIGFTFSGSVNPRRQLLRYLRDRSLLILLDNIEHLLPANYDFLHALIQETEAPKVLLTSRERPGLSEEWIIDIAGLPYPQGELSEVALAQASRYPAIQLFTRQSQRVIPGFELAGDYETGGPCTLGDAIRIVRQVQGLPLGIELAASWVRALSCAEIAAQIEHNLDFLRSTSSSQDGRHHSLRAVFDYSWQLLDGEEQQALRRLSVFHGPFDSQSAQAVTGVTLTTLSGLVDHSWLRRSEIYATGAPIARFEFLELMRQYAAEKLALDEQEAYATTADHADYFMDLLARQNADLEGAGQLPALEVISRNIQDFRMAWRWSAEHAHILNLAQALDPLHQFYYMRSWFNEGAEQFGLAASCLESLQESVAARITWAQLTARHGWFTFLLGSQQAGQALLAESAAILRADAPPEDLAYALSFNAAALSLMGNYDAATAKAEEALLLTQSANDKFGQIVAQNILSQITFQLGDYRAAQRFCEGSLTLERDMGNRWSMGFTLTNLGRVAFAQEDYSAAQAYFEKSLAIRQSMADERGQATCLHQLGKTAVMLGSAVSAQQYYEASLLIFRRIGSQDDAADTLNSIGWLALSEQDLHGARRAFLSALETAQKSTALPRILEAVVGLATLEADEDPAQAANLARLVAAHPATSFSSRARAHELLAEQGFSEADLVDAAGEHADLDEVIDALLLQQLA